MIEKSKMIHDREEALVLELESVNREKEQIILEYRNKAHTDINARYHVLELEYEQQRQSCLIKMDQEHTERLKELDQKLLVLDSVSLKNKEQAVNAVIQEVSKYGNR